MAISPVCIWTSIQALDFTLEMEILPRLVEAMETIALACLASVQGTLSQAILCGAYIV
jgi:hypothetical protein